MKNRLPKPVLLAAAFALSAGVAQAAITPFSTDVNTAIDDGLQYLRNQGVFNTGGPCSAQSQTRGLTLLALLEKRASADPAAPPLGYKNSSPADQVLEQNAVSLIIDDGCYGANQLFYAYAFGESLMSLALYGRTGGPNTPAPPPTTGTTVSQAIDYMVDQTLANQDTSGGQNDGYWGYTGPGDDSSTTQYAVAGLAAAKVYYQDPSIGDPGNRIPLINAALARTAAGYAKNGRPSSCGGAGLGHGYRNSSEPGAAEPSYQQTGSGIWGQLLGGYDLNNASVQAYLRWQQDRYNYDPAGYGNFSQGWPSYYYYLWSSSKGYSFIETSGVTPNPGNITTTDLGTSPGFGACGTIRAGHLNPATVTPPAIFGGAAGKYAAEKPTWYFDYAYTLLSLMDNTGFFGSAGSWVQYDGQAYSILVLQRSLGGIVETCDINGDGKVTKADILAITTSLNQQAQPNDRRDADGNGWITVLDARICATRCTNTNCAE